MQVNTLKFPSDAQIEEMIPWIDDAFEQDLLIKTMTGGNAQSRYELFRLTLRAAALEGVVLVIQDPASQKLVSVGICFGPGTDFLGSQAQLDLAKKYFESLSDETKEWLDKVNKPISKKLIDDTIGQENVTASWFVVVMATMKTERRKGYASLIMEEFCRRVQEDKSLIVLNATSKYTVNFYQSFGLEVVGSADQPSPFGTWTDYLMVWNAKNYLNL